MGENKTTAPAGTGTDANADYIETGIKSSRYHYDNTEAAFCQALIKEIDECAREIYDNPTDNEAAAYNAGKIQGLVYALTLIRGIKS